MTNIMEIKERIAIYYREILEEIMDESEAKECFDKYFEDVYEALVQYAEEGNYWWEERNVKMAYYQMKTSVLVVPAEEFEKYYEELMGRKYSYRDMYDSETRKSLLKIAEEKYKKLTNKR